MVWHCYANISLITLQASTTFSPETNSKANILKTTLFFSLQTLCLFTLKFQTCTHNFGRFLLLIQGSCSELPFSYVLSTVL